MKQRPPLTPLEELVARYRSELRRLLARRRELDAHIAARREILGDLRAAFEAGGGAPPGGERRAPRRGRITQAEAVLRVLGDAETALTAPEIYAAAVEAGAGGSERSLRNVLSRKVRDGELVADRDRHPRRYSRARPRSGRDGGRDS